MRHLCSAAIVVSSIVATSEYNEVHAESESYEPIRFDSGLAGSYADASARSGVGFVGELKYLLHDNVGVGMRVDYQIMFGGAIGDDVEMSIAGAGAGLLKGEYYVGNGPVRPWVGGGFGVYSIGSQTISTQPETTIDQKSGRYFGVAPQVGIDLGRVRLAATYNMILGADIEVRQTIGGEPPRTSTFSQSYLTLEMSFRVGGGRKYKPAPFTPMPPNPTPYVPYGTPPPPAPFPPPAPAPYPPPPTP